MNLAAVLCLIGAAGLFLSAGFAWLSRDPLGYTPPWLDWLIAFFVVLLLISIGTLGTREADAHEAASSFDLRVVPAVFRPNASDDRSALRRVHDAPSGWSYPLSCCSNYDCREMKDGEVRETAQGYLIVATGEMVPYGDKRIRNSPDGKFHWCAHQSGVDAGKTICLFVPPRGF